MRWNPSYNTYGYIRSTNVRKWKILRQIKIHKLSHTKCAKIRVEHAQTHFHRKIYQHGLKPYTLHSYCPFQDSISHHCCESVIVHVMRTCPPVATERFLFVLNMTVHVSFLNNSHHSITNNLQHISLGNMRYSLANDQLTVTFSSWEEFNRRSLNEFPTGYITNYFWWCSSPSQIKHAAAT